MTTNTALSPGALAARADELAAKVGTFGPRSVPQDLRREHVLTCATLLFTEHGYEQTSMVDVASMAGVTKPVVYDLFGSKEELFGQVMSGAMDELLERIQAAIEGEPDPTRYGLVASRAYFQFVQERRAAWQHLLRSPAGIVGQWIEAMQRRHADELRDLIVRNLEQREIPFSARRVDAFAVMMVASITALAGWWVDHPDMALDEVARFYATTTDLGLRAVITDDPTS